MSKIKASTLLRNMELASLGAIRDMITDEVERLEDIDRMKQWTRLLSKDHKPDELPPVKEWEPLTDTRGFYWYMLIEDGKRVVGSGCALLETVKKLQIDYPNSRIVQSMAPDESGKSRRRPPRLTARV